MAAPPRRTAALGALAALALLLLAAPTPAAAVAQLRDPAGATDPTGPLVAAVALLAWALAGWLLLTAGLTLLARVPGATGRAAAGVVHRVAPAAVRQLVGAALGVTVVAGALAGPAAAAAPVGTPAPSAVTASLDWPSHDAAPPAPDLDWPTGPAADAPEPEAPAAPPAAAPHLDWPAEPAAPVLGAATSTGAAADAVVVQPGDSLWSVAEDALARDQQAAPTEAEVAAAWPAWWSANRDAVGDDPDLLLPGTALRPPTDTD